MNSKVILFAFLSLLVGFSACNKNDDGDVYKPILPVPLIKTMTVINRMDGLTHIFSFEYDELGRITKTENNGDPYEKFKYIADTLIMREKYNSNNSNNYMYGIDTLRLNEQGLVTSNIGKEKRVMYSRSYGYGYEEYLAYYGTCQYDTDGYLINANPYDGYHQDFKVADGNTVETTIRNWTPYHEVDSINYDIENDSIYNDTITNTFNYQHYTTSANTIGNENMGMTWMGKQDKNLLKEYRGTTYTYIYDSKRRVIKKTYIFDTGSYYETYTYY